MWSLSVLLNTCRNLSGKCRMHSEKEVHMYRAVCIVLSQCCSLLYICLSLCSITVSHRFISCYEHIPLQLSSYVSLQRPLMQFRVLRAMISSAIYVRLVPLQRFSFSDLLTAVFYCRSKKIQLIYYCVWF